MIGSVARDSASTNSGSSSAASTASTTIGVESHAYVVPPRLIRRISADSPPVRSDAPSQSILCRTRSTGALKTTPITTSATAPIGRLT